jgi:hypothetical protein
LVRPIRKPQAQSLLCELMMAEVVGKTQNPDHVTTAHFCGGFADLAIELGCFFDDQNTRFGSFAFEHERRRRAGKSATDDYDVVV